MNYTIDLTRWEKMMVDYGFYHQKTLNLITHFIGVPIIVASVLVPLTWLNFFNVGWAGSTLPVNLALVASIALALFYVSLDRKLGLLSIPFIIALLFVANHVGSWSMLQGGIYAAIGFFGGFALQFIGHGIEGKKPALLAYNPIIAMISSPLFVVAEFGQAIGVRRELFKKVNDEIKRLEE